MDNMPPDLQWDVDRWHRDQPTRYCYREKSHAFACDRIYYSDMILRGSRWTLIAQREAGPSGQPAPPA